MHRPALGLVCALLISLVSGAAAQEPKATTTIAGVLLSLNHFPSDEQKKTLTSLSAAPTTTADEKVLIKALLGVQHGVTTEDKTQLQALVKKATAAADVKTIAGILERLMHAPTAADKEELKRLAQ